MPRIKAQARQADHVKSAIEPPELVGHDHILAMFKRFFDCGRLAHAYLLTGPKDVGKFALASELAKLVLGSSPIMANETHPDYVLVERGNDPKTGEPRTIIAIEQIHALRGRLSRKPMLGGWQVAIVRDAQLLNRESGNALLKTLEEPQERTLILLTAPDAESVLPTVRSRCQEVRLSRVPAVRIAEALRRYGEPEDRAKVFSRLADGCPVRALRLARDSEAYGELHEARGMVFAMSGADVATRWEFVERLLPKKHAFQEAKERAERFLDISAELLRDVALVRHGLADRIVHADVESEVRRMAETVPSVGRAIAELYEARRRISENVGPRAALQVFVLMF